MNPRNMERKIPKLFTIIKLAFWLLLVCWLHSFATGKVKKIVIYWLLIYSETREKNHSFLQCTKSGTI